MYVLCMCQHQNSSADCQFSVNLDMKYNFGRQAIATSLSGGFVNVTIARVTELRKRKRDLKEGRMQG